MSHAGRCGREALSRTRRARGVGFAILLPLLLGAIGCHTMRFEVANEPVSHVVFDRKSFFLWGLTPTRKVDVSTHCPSGVAAIREQTQFSDGFFSFVTLGIWQPRSSWYYCLSEKVQP